MAYVKTNWVDNTTPIDENNLNKIEQGIKNNDINIGEENYDNTKTYEVGDIVRYNEKIYKCITAITTAENFDISKWEQTNIVEIVQSEKSKIYELIEAISTPIVGEGENITLNDTAEKRFENFDIEGNSKQETRSGKNLLELMEGTYSDNGITAVVKNGIITLNGTATGTSFVEINLLKSIELTNDKVYHVSAFNEKTVGDGTNYCSLRLIQANIQVLFNTANANGSITTNLEIPYITIRTAQGITYNNFVIKPQLELGNGTDTWEQGGASPSPDYLSQVKAVGDNVNLFDKDDEQYILKNMFTDGSSKKISSYTGTYSIALPIKPNTTYTIYRGFGTKDSYKVATSDNNVLGSSINNLSSFIDTKYYTIKTSNESKYLIIWYYWDSKETYTEEEIRNSIKIVEGTETGEYSPYGQGCINEVICNKNLFNVSVLNDYSQNGITLTKNEGTNKIKLNVTPTKNFTIYSKDLDVNMFEIGEKYSLSKDFSNITFSFEVFENNSNTASIWATSITMQKSYTRVRVYLQGKANTTFNNQEIALQLEKGNATEIVAHQSQSYTMPTQQPMRAIGDTRDKFILKENGKWYERHYIARKIFDGTETFTIETRGEVTNFYTSVEGFGSQKGYCNILPVKIDSSYTVNILFIWANLKGISMMFEKSRFSTVSDYQAYLAEQYNAGTPVYVDYVLATPTDIECTSEQTEILNQIYIKAKSYKGVTHIYSNDEVRPNCYVEAVKDLTTLIQ